MNQPITSRPPQAAVSKRLRGTTAAIGAETEVVIASVQLLNGVAPVLESLYYDGDAGGTGYLRFKVTLDGRPLHHDWAQSDNPIGKVGQPEPIGEDLPGGRLLEVRCENRATAAQVAADSSLGELRAYCDGEVAYYEKPLR